MNLCACVSVCVSVHVGVVDEISRKLLIALDWKFISTSDALMSDKGEEDGMVNTRVDRDRAPITFPGHRERKRKSNSQTKRRTDLKRGGL